MGRLRSLFGAGTAVLLLLLLLSIMTELAVRLFVYGIKGISYHRMDSFVPIGVSGLLQASADSGIRYELKPNLDDYFKGARLQTNSTGMRDGEYSIEKRPGQFRVAVIGASFTMPAGVEIEDAYFKELERRFSDRYPEVEFQFLNFSVAGYSKEQMLRALEVKAVRYNPDLILVGFTTGIGRPQEYLPKPREGKFFQSAVCEFYERDLAQVFGEAGGEAARHSRPSTLHPKGKQYLAFLYSEFERVQSELGVPVVVALLETWNVDIVAEFTQLADGYEFEVVDTSKPFKAMTPEQRRSYWIHKWDRHPNPAAHRLIADEIYGVLLDHPAILQLGAGQ